MTLAALKIEGPGERSAKNVALEDGKGKKTESPQELPREYLDFSSGKLISVLQNCKHTINTYYLKQPTLW